MPKLIIKLAEAQLVGKLIGERAKKAGVSPLVLIEVVICIMVGLSHWMELVKQV